MWAWDATNDKIYMGLNGTWFNSGDPAAGTGQIIDTEDLSASSYYFKLGYTADGGTPTLTTVTSGNSGSSNSLSTEGDAAPTTFNPFIDDTVDTNKIASNYATLSPVQRNRTGITLSENNSRLQTSTEVWKTTQATIGMRTGKFYCEFGPFLWNDANNHCQPGVCFPVTIIPGSNRISC